MLKSIIKWTLQIIGTVSIIFSDTLPFGRNLWIAIGVIFMIGAHEITDHVKW